MAEGLKIGVQADVQGAVAGINKLNSSIDILQAQFERLQKLASLPNLNFRQQERLNGLLLSTQSELNKSKRAFDQVNPAMLKYQKTTSSATLATLNFGRVIQDAPFGILGVANNINPLVESFQRLKTETGSTGKAFKALGGSLVGAGGIGLAVSAITTGLLLFGDQLFGSSKKASTLSLELATLKQSTEDAKKAFEDFNTELDFLQKIGSLTVDFNFEDEGIRSALKASQASIRLDEEIYKLNGTLNTVQQNASKTFDIFQQKASDAAQELQRSFGLPRNIPEGAIGDFSDKDQQLLKDAIGSSKELLEVQEQLKKLENDRRFARATIRLTNLEIQRKKDKEALGKANADYEKYVSDIISRGKELSTFFSGRRVVPQFTIFDTRSDEFKKAQQVINDFAAGSLPLIFRPTVEIVPVLVKSPDTISAIKQSLTDLEASLKQDAPDLKLNISASVTTTLAANNKEIDKIRKNLEELGKMGEFIGGKLADGFTGVFDAIISGESVIQTFGNAIKQLISDLIQAAIRALIVKAITNLFAPGLGSAGTGGLGAMLGRIPGFAAGGMVTGPTLAVIGEGSGTSRSNPEVVAPLDQLRSMLAGIGGTGSQNVYVTGRLRGRDMVLQNARTSRSQRRTTGR